jgi:DNA-binding NarL/FixJ family response regulator
MADIIDGKQRTLASDTGIFSDSEWLELVNELCLSTRQAEVVKCLFHGQSDKQIAFELQILRLQLWLRAKRTRKRRA